MKSVAPMEVGITVRDIDSLLPFYRDILGLKVLSDIVAPAEKSRPAGLAPDGYRIMRLESNAGDRIKLAQPTGMPKAAPAEAPAREFALQKAGGGYVTFIVEDMSSLLADLQKAGVTIKSQGKVEVRAGVWVMLAADPEGNYLEFVEYADLSSYRP
jgi:lactoylglutathione lyase